MDLNFESIKSNELIWKKTSNPVHGLDLDYTILLSKPLANQVLSTLDNDVEYFTGDLTKVRVFGKWHPIPRQQAAFGDEGMSYKFSGNTVPALPWPEVLLKVRDLLARVTGHDFNFVLVNRYRDGGDHMGEHRDDEVGLDAASPIASLSLGEARDFVLKHADARRSGPTRKDIERVKLLLEHGSLLMMNPPTNKLWYHSLPPRKGCRGVRINLTFRKLK